MIYTPTYTDSSVSILQKKKYYYKIKGDHDEKIYVGGCDSTLAWCREGSYFSHVISPSATAASPITMTEEADVHEFDYDLVVIGGTTRIEIIKC